MRLLFAAAEMYPYVKTGGLGDMAYALPKALGTMATVVTVVPLYDFIDRERYGIRPLGERFSLELGAERCEVELFGLHREGIEQIFVYEEGLCARAYPYGPPGEAYPDNDRRFALFCHAIVEIARGRKIDILHLNDWHTALATVLARDEGVGVKTLFTIHNLAYQGVFDRESLERTGVHPRHFQMEDMEFYGRVNWMKGGIAHADLVTTVSPSYAVEIQRAEFGCGLDGFLRRHRDKLVGVLNGIDTAFFDPASDPALPCRFDAKRLAGKRACKSALLDALEIAEKGWPLFLFIGRFVEQKGIDLLIEAAPKLAEMRLSLVILGDGDGRFHDALEAIDAQWENIRVLFGYDEVLSHRLYGAADFLLMPSRFEPCGLNQMIAMRYGTMPVVHAVGGLRDTVHDPEEGEVCGLGVRFERYSVDALLEAVERATKLYRRSSRFEALEIFDMGCDFSIEKCARRYMELYRGLR